MKRRLDQLPYLASVARLASLRSIVFALSSVAGANFLVKGMTGVRDVVVARSFGASVQVDAHLIALLIPTTLASIVGGSISSAFVPYFVESRAKGDSRRTQDAMSQVLALLLVIVAVLVLLIGIVGDSVVRTMGPGMSAEGRALALHFYWALVPAFALSSLAGFLSGVLAACGDYFVASLIPVVTPMVGLLLLSLPWWGGSPWVLPLGLLLGALIELTACAVRVRRRAGLVLKPQFELGTPLVRTISVQAAAMAVASLTMAATAFLTQTWAGGLGDAQLALLNYAGKLPALIQGFSVSMIGTVIFPRVALVVVNDRENVGGYLRNLTIATFSGTVVASVLLWGGSDLAARVAFGAGAINVHDLAIIASLQRILATSLPFYVVGMIFVRAICAMGAQKLLLPINLCSVLFLAGLGAYLVPLAGNVGIATAQVAAQVATSLMLLIAVVSLVKSRARGQPARLDPSE